MSATVDGAFASGFVIGGTSFFGSDVSASVIFAPLGVGDVDGEALGDADPSGEPLGEGVGGGVGVGLGVGDGVGVLFPDFARGCGVGVASGMLNCTKHENPADCGHRKPLGACENGYVTVSPGGADGEADAFGVGACCPGGSCVPACGFTGGLMLPGMLVPPPPKFP